MATMSRFPSFFDFPHDRSDKNLTSLSTISELRPQTSSGPQPAPRRRRRTDTIDSIRNSIFGARKRSDGDSSSRPISQHTAHGLRPTTPVVITNSEEEFYRHRKKSSISPPFNFQHISHAARGSLPPLDTVSEYELQQHLYSDARLAAPPGELRDIKAEKLQERVRLEAASCEDLHDQYRADQYPPDIIVDETTFDEAHDTRFDPATCVPSLQPVEGVKQPRRHASMFSLGQAAEWLSLRTERITECEETSPTTSDSVESGPTYNSSTSGDTIVQDAILPRPATLSVVLDVPHADFEHPNDDIRSDRLSPVDQHSNKSMKSAAQSHLSVASFTSSVRSFPSSSSRYTTKSLAFSSTDDSPRDYRLSGLSWEEEIDFMYEQEAEATCNFDWHRYTRTSGGTCSMSSQPYLPQHLTSQSTLATSSTRYGSTPNLVASPKSPKHVRGSSVGHRGFLLARNASAEKLSPTLRPESPPIDLSPVLSEASEAYYTPRESEKIRPASVGGIGSRPFGDAHAPPTKKSWHRKSKSYGSPTDCSNAAKKTSRWSIASVACIPEMLYNSLRLGNNEHKRTDSRPLKALPSLPDASGTIQRSDQKELPPLPPCPPIQEVSPSREDGATTPATPTSPREDHPRVFPDDEVDARGEEADHVPVMRRPQSPGERAALQAAGSAVRRSRPSRLFTHPSRYSHLSESPRSPPPVGWI